MKKIAITYSLSVAGQRASLLANGNGRAEQVILLDPTPELLDTASIDRNGTAIIDATCTIGWIVDADSGEARRERSARIHFALDLPATTWQEIESARDAAIEARRIEELALLPDLRASAVRLESQRLETVMRREAEDAANILLAEEYVAGDASVTMTGYNLCRGSRSVATWTLPADCAAAVAAEEERREESSAKADLEWISAHGSERLKKCVVANMLARCKGILRDERLEFDRPAWAWDKNTREDKIKNPTEAELDALAETRLAFPNANLMRVCDNWESDGECRLEWRTVIIDHYDGQQILKEVK